MDIDKLKLTQLPLVVKDDEGSALGQITVMVNHSLTSASFTMTFQNENKVLNNQKTIKEAYDSMQDFFMREMSSCGWAFLFESESVEDPTTNEGTTETPTDTEQPSDTETVVS